LLLFLTSASAPMKPMRVSLLRHAFLLFCPCVLGHPEASGHRSQGKELLFWGDQNGGARTWKAPSGEAEAPQTAGRGNWPEAVPRTKGQNRRNHVSGAIESGKSRNAQITISTPETWTSGCSEQNSSILPNAFDLRGESGRKDRNTECTWRIAGFSGKVVTKMVASAWARHRCRDRPS
jgi:hypothetical protein